MAPVRSSRLQRGNALVEFVLVLPLLLTLMLAAIDWGWYFMVREVAVNATRQGARVGSAAPNAGVAANNAQTALQTYLSSALGATYLAPNSATVADCTGGVAGRCITVRITAFPVVPSRPTQSLSGLGAWTRAPATLNAQTEMRLELQP